MAYIFEQRERYNFILLNLNCCVFCISLGLASSLNYVLFFEKAAAIALGAAPEISVALSPTALFVWLMRHDNSGKTCPL
jgi:membrane associated rhomboid family serine protease